MRYEIRDATRAHFEAFFGVPPPHAFHGVVALEGDTVRAIGGIMYANPSIAFLNVSPEVDVKAHKRETVQGIRRVQEMLRKSHRRVCAVPADETVAPGFLQHVGFMQVDRGVFLWQS